MTRRGPSRSEQEMYKLVGQRIADARVRVGLTQEQVAKILGLSRASVANIETGRQYTLLHLYARIAGMLGAPLSRLIA